MSGALFGRRVVVTGAGGIGMATARTAVAGGGRVHLVDVDDSVRAAAAEHDLTASVADLRRQPEAERAMTEAADALGGVDGLVAVAGGSGRRYGDGPLADLTDDGLNQTLSLNTNTALNSLAAFLRVAERPASAVLIGSVLADHPHPLFATHGYAAAKAAVEGAARAAACYYVAEGIRINVVAAGLTRTPMSRRAQGDEATAAFACTKQPLTADGFVDPEDVADACGWLLAARSITGQVIAVDGGWSVSPGTVSAPNV